MKRSDFWTAAAVAFLVCLCVVPFVYVLVSSMLNMDGRFTLEYYYQVFLGQTQFLYRFWKSVGLSTCIAAGQVVVSALAGYGFAKFRFPGKNVLFFLLMILMILPLQVTLMPNYIVLRDMGLLDSYYALILPAVIVPLGTFIMTQSFRAVPNSVLEAARLDGCSTLGILARIVLPLNKSGLICVTMLSFLDAWNMVEQPITYLKEFTSYPIGVALASVPPGDPTMLLACCVLVTLPPLFLFVLFNRELAEGIALGGEK